MTDNTIQLLLSNKSADDEHKILCCLCAVPISPNPANMCISCIRSQVDITEDISKQEIMYFCKLCERYLQPPKHWMVCDLESRELLQLCLKRIKGLNKVKLIDANFVWTEPHSRRLKVKLTIQKEVFNGAWLQQSVIVEFVLKSMQCETCQKSFTKNTWKAVAQVRQKVDHKRTFFFLEQLILKHEMHKQCLRLKERPDGIDFFFGQKGAAQNFVQFIQNFCPIRFKISERLLTQDDHSNIYDYKYSYSVEIAPICREDVICLPKKMSKSMGGFGPIVLCNRVSAYISLIDPMTLKIFDISSDIYWKQPFYTLLSTRYLVEYTVLDIEPIDNGKSSGKHKLAEAQVVKSDLIGNNEDVIFTKTHLGNILKPGDTVLGYDLKYTNFNNDHVNEINPKDFPDVILVRKIYKKRRERNWKLKRMAVENAKDDDDDDGEVEEQKNTTVVTKSKNKKQKSKSKEKKENKESNPEKDYQRFLEELEECEDYRSAVNIYKKKSTPLDNSKPNQKSEEEEEVLEIPEEELKEEEDEEISQ